MSLAPPHSWPIKSECLGMCILCRAPWSTWAFSLQWEPWFFSVSENEPPGANFISQCPIFLLLTERNSKATYLEGHYGKQLHPWTLNYFRASVGRCKHFVTLIPCYTKGHRNSWCKTMKFSIRFHLSGNFAKGREKTAGFSARLNRFCLKSNNQFTVLDLEGTSILRTNNVRFYSLHINCALAVCIQMKPKHE